MLGFSFFLVFFYFNAVLGLSDCECSDASVPPEQCAITFY